MDRLRFWLAYRLCELYQYCGSLPSLLGLTDYLMDLLNWIERLVSPSGAEPDEIDGVMADIIRKRMGVSEEKWSSDLNKARRKEELESLGLPGDEDIEL